MNFININQLLRAGKTAAAVMVGASALSFSTAYAQTLTENDVGYHDGFYYSFWKDSGDASFGLEAEGRYTSQWTNSTNNWVGGKGWNPGGPKVVNYTGSYNVTNQDNSYLALYGWTRNPLIEYYVVESYGSYNPGSGGQRMGSFESDGATYDVYRDQRVNQPSIEGDTTFYQYFSIRRDKKPFGAISGTITVGNHFDAWASMGLELGTHDYMVMATEGYQSRGSSDITVSEGARDCGTSDSGLPACCDISADRNGDGFGEQFGGQMCVVTEETAGWHPANPENILAAINMGGSGEAIAIGDIWYAPSTFVTGGTPYSNPDEVSGGGGSAVYQTELYGDLTVEIPMENQAVIVELGFVELYHEEAGARLFNVSIEGQQVLSNVDVFAEAGRNVLWQPTPFEVNVTDGSLTISLATIEDNATISSVLVRKAEGGASSSSSAASSSSPASSSAPASSSSAPTASSSAAASSAGSEPGRAGGLNGWFLMILASLFMASRRVRRG